VNSLCDYSAMDIFIGGVGDTDVSTGCHVDGIVAEGRIGARHIQAGDGFGGSIRIGMVMAVQSLFGIENALVDSAAELTEEGSILMCVGL
jgi:UDP-glucose 6-dehydrogenase